MPRLPSTGSTRTPPTRAQRARRLLAGVGISREDSDDELGYEDHPWEWIYEGKSASDDGSSNKENEPHSDLLVREGDADSSIKPEASMPKGRNARGSKGRTRGPRIIGARMGNFECRLGDCVLLKAEGTNEAWVGLICEFGEEEAESEEDDGGNDEPEQRKKKMANIMWFSTEKEIKNKEKKRRDFMPNELYITPSWDMNPLASINGKAQILSPSAFYARFPNGRIPRNSRDYGKVFICRRGCNTRTATYTEEFIWQDMYRGREEDIFALINKVQNETKATRKRRRDAKQDGGDREEVMSIDQEGSAVPETPKKRRKLTQASTPQSQHSVRTPQKFTTPSHRRFVVKKPLEFTPLGTRILSPSHILSSPFQVARSRLHVASVPEALPCREQEFQTVYAHLEAAICDGSGSCIYISGTPGTGKTATVREVIAQLNASVLAEELDDFVFVEINGMKVTDPHQAYSLLWEALRGDRVSPAHALDLLEREFSHPSPRRVPCVVLMDELDQLVTRNQSVMYNFFNWPGLAHSRLIVLAVANTMDLPERTLSNKISSRLGLTRITFPGYTHDQLMKIIESRLEGVAGGIVDPDAVQFASRKVAAVSGDARRALDICRRAVEIAEDESRQLQNDDDDDDDDDDDESMPATPSKSAARRGKTTPAARGGKGTMMTEDTKTKPRTDMPNSKSKAKKAKQGKVTIATIKRAIHEATTNSLQQYLRSLPLACKVFLAAMLARTRRSGVRESLLGHVIDEAKTMAKMADAHTIQTFLLAETSWHYPSSSSSAFPPPPPPPPASSSSSWLEASSQDKSRARRRVPVTATTTTTTAAKATAAVQAAAAGAARPVPRILAVGAAAAELVDAGVIGLEGRRADRAGKVRLNVGEDEIKLALKDDAEVRGLGFSA